MPSGEYPLLYVFGFFHRQGAAMFSEHVDGDEVKVPTRAAVVEHFTSMSLLLRSVFLNYTREQQI
jgi:hypothetical protein